MRRRRSQKNRSDRSGGTGRPHAPRPTLGSGKSTEIKGPEGPCGKGPETHGKNNDPKLREARRPGNQARRQWLVSQRKGDVAPRFGGSAGQGTKPGGNGSGAKGSETLHPDSGGPQARETSPEATATAAKGKGPTDDTQWGGGIGSTLHLPTKNHGFGNGSAQEAHKNRPCKHDILQRSRRS